MIFYAPEIGVSNFLSEEESAHAVRVLRLNTGDRVELVDGKGGYYEAEIVVPNSKRCEFKVLSKIDGYNARNYKIHVAIAPTKNMDRIEWFAEKATEIGIDEITPVICRFSERKVIKSERLEKIVVSAMKQSKKASLPIINNQVNFSDFLKRNDLGQKFIAHCYEKDKKDLTEAYLPCVDSTILIGPEGDFSEEEIDSAIRAGFVPVSLGESRLRTETAALVSCHTMNLISYISSHKK